MTGKRLIEKLDSLGPISFEAAIQERTRKIPDIAFIHQRHLRVLVQYGAKQRSAGTEYTDDKDGIFVQGHFLY